MQINYQEIDTSLLDKIAAKYGEIAKKHIHTDAGSSSFAAMCGDAPVGFISTYTRNLSAPISEEKDAYIDIIEVDAAYRRMGIAAQLVSLAEKWAKKAGLLQIRAWSSQDKAEAIPMWRNLGYGLCPAKIWVEWCKEIVDGYYAVKQLNPVNPYPGITGLIRQDLQGVSPTPVGDFRLIRAKSGVYVYRCRYGGAPAVVKYFENSDDRREILNYQILARHNIPTVKTLALGQAALVMEDISVSEEWRLGKPEDFHDTEVTKGLAGWYFAFHESGVAVPELDTLFFEYDSLTKENLKLLSQKIPEANQLLQLLISRYGRLRKLLYKPNFTLTYNDFHWSNLIVRKDRQAAMMMDFNLMGRGYRFSDFRNVCWGLSPEAKAAFASEYNRLYLEKHGHCRTQAEAAERRIDEVLAPLYSLVVALTKNDSFPQWAEDAKREAASESMPAKAKALLL